MRTGAALAVLLAAPALGAGSQCPPSLFRAAGLGAGFNESIAHAIHSLTAEGLRLFNAKATGRAPLLAAAMLWRQHCFAQEGR
eukprot:gene3109-3694_t